MTSNISLSNVTIKLRRGSIENLPSSAPAGEPLIVNNQGAYELWAGTGSGVVKISAGGGGGGASFTIDQTNHGFDNDLVRYNYSTQLWELAYADEIDGVSHTAIGFATSKTANTFLVTMLGKVDLTTEFTDVNDNPLEEGEYYFLCQTSTNAGKVQKARPTSGIVQLLFQCIKADTLNNEYSLILLNYPPYDLDEQSYGGIQSFTFDSNSLSSGVITFHHALNSTAVHTQIYDNNGYEIIPDSVQIIDSNTITVDVSSLTVDGIWKAIFIGGTNPEIIREFPDNPFLNIVELTDDSIGLQPDTVLYKRVVTANTTFVFDTTDITLSTSKAYTFELCIVMSTAKTLGFPNNVIWQNGETPDTTNTGTYFFTFRTIDAGNTWMGSPSGVWQ